MSNLAVKILSEVKAVGGVVELLPPDKLRVSAPRELAEQVKAHKPEILAHLQNNIHPADLRYQDDERAGLMIGNGHPQDWADVAAAFMNQPRPAACPPERWQQIMDDAGRFLDSHWSNMARIFGWQPESVFNLRGFIMLLNGGVIQSISNDTALIRLQNSKRRDWLRYVALTGETEPKWRIWKSICEP